jgi:hypothetical protein
VFIHKLNIPLPLSKIPPKWAGGGEREFMDGCQLFLDKEILIREHTSDIHESKCIHCMSDLGLSGGEGMDVLLERMEVKHGTKTT